MKFTPRYYQVDAARAAIDHLKKSLETQVLWIGCGGGKSVIIALIADEIRRLSGKNVLCTAPTSKLSIQDYDKFRALGQDASMFSASSGMRKELNYPVVYGTPVSLLNAKNHLKGFGAIIVDEGHGLTPTIKSIIDHLRSDNPQLRVILLSATPYRTGMGWIFERHYKKGYMEEAINPFASVCTYEINEKQLTSEGFLTPIIANKNQLSYHTELLEMDKKGKWTEDSLNKVYFSGQERLTADIIKHIVLETEHYNSVMIFCATNDHCMEAMKSLPPDLSRVVFGDSPGRKKIEEDFEKVRFKFLVSNMTQKEGVDYPAVDCIALLRHFESKNLFAQVAGRGTRLYKGKTHCRIMDFGENRGLYENGDVFDIVVEAKSKKAGERIPCKCEKCGHENAFIPRPNEASHVVSEYGYWLWQDNDEFVLDPEGRKIPSHLGRRCFGIVNKKDRCDYRWTFKLCPNQECGHENDIAARKCEKCKEEIIDPNKKLAMEEQERKEKPLTEYVLKIDMTDRLAKNGSKLKVVTIKTVTQKTIKLFLSMKSEVARETFRMCRDMVGRDCNVTFNKPANTGFYKFIDIKETDL